MDCAKDKRKPRADWDVKASSFAQATFNPIRSIVDGMKLAPHPDKPMIALSIGKFLGGVCLEHSIMKSANSTYP
jgi:hypothetical protein